MAPQNPFGGGGLIPILPPLPPLDVYAISPEIKPIITVNANMSIPSPPLIFLLKVYQIIFLVPFFPPFPYFPRYQASHDDGEEEEYPMPEFYPLPPFPFGLPNFLSSEREELPPSLRPKERQRREALVETYDVSIFSSESSI